MSEELTPEEQETWDALNRKYHRISPGVYVTETDISVASPVEGMISVEHATGRMHVYDGTQWIEITDEHNKQIQRQMAGIE